MTGWCECCAYETCIFDGSPETGEDYCSRREEVFPEDELLWLLGGDFCEICLEIVTETIAGEEMMTD